MLGADNQAAMATLEAELKHSEVPRGDVFLAFVSDEEIGLLGAEAMDLSRFPMRF